MSSARPDTKDMMNMKKNAYALIALILSAFLLTGCDGLSSSLDDGEQSQSAQPGAAKACGAHKGKLAAPKAAKCLLDTLAVKRPNSGRGYERPHTWDKASKYHVDAPMSSCSIRNYILYRDGKNVSLSNRCYPTSGTWLDPYTNTTYGVGGAQGEPTTVNRLQIEHIVPLKNAYMSGADTWTENTLRNFAHDVNNLIVVFGSGNESKGFKGPEEWEPENKAYHCTYAEHWTQTKSEYNLSVSPAEKKALSSMLDTCKGA